MTMIERVAKAITWADLSDDVRSSFEERGITAETVYAEESMFRLAKAALDAMRVPTEKMIAEMESAATYGIGKPADDEAILRLWHWAIDAAINERT